MNQNEMLALYENSGALLTGHFVLSSGRHSARYLQSALVLEQPQNSTQLAQQLVNLVQGEAIDLVVAPALGGLIIGYEVARLLNKPFIFTERKEGEMQLRRGFTIASGARVLVVEDVITTGGSVRECMAVVKACGGVPFQVVAVVDRAPDAEGRFDVPHQTAITMQVETYTAEACPLCAAGTLPAVKPGSRGHA
ncbi:MAG: orotate phosphoribosyltransferase [Zetaproteobacteria bacterium]|nr:orotate phosphoribosyltransferase [Zetaproteobacteria bacterium]